jgi:hypothetical protein
MSEESNVATPQPEVPASAQPADAQPGGAQPGEPADARAPDTPAPDAVTPDAPATTPWFRRKPLIVGFGAGLLVAAVIAAVVLVIVPSGGQRLKYTGMPAPCITVAAATLAKYMPDATSSPQSMASSSSHQVGACSWSSITAGQNRNLLVEVDVFSSSSGLTSAQQAYQRFASASACCKNLTVSTRSVTGLGDQAAVHFITDKPAAKGATVPPPGVILAVRSGNADINLIYSTFPIGSARLSLTPAAELTGTIAMARDVLAALANPAAAASAAATPTTATSPAPTAPSSPPGPRYASPRDACTLVKASTLARYTPGAAADKIPVPSNTVPGAPQLSNCAWAAPNGSIVLELTVDSDSASAQQGYEFGVQFARQNGNETTFHGAQTVTGVGQQATAIFETLTGSPSVALYVWSGNAEFEVSITDLPFSTPLSRATKLAADISMARDVLADLPA